MPGYVYDLAAGSQEFLLYQRHTVEIKGDMPYFTKVSQNQLGTNPDLNCGKNHLAQLQERCLAGSA